MPVHRISPNRLRRSRTGDHPSGPTRYRIRCKGGDRSAGNRGSLRGVGTDSLTLAADSSRYQPNHGDRQTCRQLRCRLGGRLGGRFESRLMTRQPHEAKIPRTQGRKGGRVSAATSRPFEGVPPPNRTLRDHQNGSKVHLLRSVDLRQALPRRFPFRTSRLRDCLHA